MSFCSQAVLILRPLSCQGCSALSLGVYPPACHPCGCVGPKDQLQGAPSAPRPCAPPCCPPNLSWCLGLLPQREDSAEGWSLPPGTPTTLCRTCSSRKHKCIHQDECIWVAGLARQSCLLLRTKKRSLEMLCTSGDELLKRGGAEGRHNDTQHYSESTSSSF